MNKEVVILMAEDDEGHFLIAKKGWLVLRAAGRGEESHRIVSAKYVGGNVDHVEDGVGTWFGQ